MYFINLQTKTLAGQQLSCIVYRLGEASALSSEARNPRLLYLEGEDKLNRVEFRNFRRGCLVKNASVCVSLPRRALHSMTGVKIVTAAIITLVYCLNFDVTGSVRHAIKRMTVNTLTNTDEAKRVCRGTIRGDWRRERCRILYLCTRKLFI